MAAVPVIHRINAKLAEMADGKRVRLLNVNGKLAGADGRLFEGMMNSDKLYLSVKGYQAWGGWTEADPHRHIVVQKKMGRYVPRLLGGKDGPDLTEFNIGSAALQTGT